MPGAVQWAVNIFSTRTVPRVGLVGLDEVRSWGKEGGPFPARCEADLLGREGGRRLENGLGSADSTRQ